MSPCMDRSLLASDPEHVGFWYRGGRSPPKEWAQWADLITSLTRALIGRYGLAEVEQWYFEVWNEPNCGFYDTAPCCGPRCGNHSAYLELFTHTRAAVKAAAPSLRVGGPATAELGWLDSFLEGAHAAAAPPDFLSTHLYPTDPTISHTRDGFAAAIEGAVATVAKTAAGLEVPPPPILLTEFNCGLGVGCADAPYAASFVARQARRANATAHAIPLESYWTFSDIFEEGGQVPSEFSQAFGMQSINGVPKPVYRALQLVRRLHPRALPVSLPVQHRAVLAASPTTATGAAAEDERGRRTVAGDNGTIDLVVTMGSARGQGGGGDGDGAGVPPGGAREGGVSIEALLSNHPTGPKAAGLAALNRAQTRGKLPPPPPPRKGPAAEGAGSRRAADDDDAALLADVAVTIRFEGRLPAGQRVDLRRVDATHANALPLYHAMGAPAYPNATALAALQQASAVRVERVVPVADGEGAWKLRVVMPAFSVAALSFELASGHEPLPLPPSVSVE